MNNHTVSRVGQSLHLEQANLVETAGKEVDNMPVVEDALGKAIIELSL